MSQEDMTLEGAIAQQIELGGIDPLDIARNVERLFGKEWVIEQLTAYAEELVAQIARARLGSIRRSAEVALRPGDIRSQAEIQIAKFWVPNYGWKRTADCTLEDVRARAHFYDVLSMASARRAHWCRLVVVMMEDEEVATVGELKAPLPPLPDEGEIAA